MTTTFSASSLPSTTPFPRVMELLDETAIKALIVRERFARDTGQWKMLRDSYHPDASQTKLHTMW